VKLHALIFQNEIGYMSKRSPISAMCKLP